MPGSSGSSETTQGSRGTAAVFVGPGRPFSIREYPLPELEPGSVLVKIAVSNICGSDLHIVRGESGGGRESILGHEMVGRVYALGKGKTTDSLGRPIKEGDRVVYQAFQPCWSCPVCLSGMTRACPKKWGPQRAVGEWPYFTGGFAQYYYVTPGRAFFKVEDNSIPDSLLASVNCAFSTVMQGLQMAGLRLGESCVIQGAGGLGLLAAVIAKEMGASPLIVIDGVHARLVLAREFGADEVIDISEVTTPADRVALVKRHTEGWGAEVVVEVAGVRAAVLEGWAMLRPSGRYLEIGNVGQGRPVDYNPADLVFGCRTIYGTVLYEPRIIPQVLNFISRNLTRYPFEKLISHTYRLEQIDKAFADAEWLGREQPHVIRAALVP